MNSLLLLILDKEKLLIPINKTAFTIAQNSKMKLNQEYAGATVIQRDGKAWQIRDIDTDGYWGDSFFSKLVSVLTGAYKIDVSFDEVNNPDLDNLKKRIIEYIKADTDTGDPYLPQSKPLERLFAEIESATYFSQIFDAINIPKLDECLDSL